MNEIKDLKVGIGLNGDIIKSIRADSEGIKNFNFRIVRNPKSIDDKTEEIVISNEEKLEKETMTIFLNHIKNDDREKIISNKGKIDYKLLRTSRKAAVLSVDIRNSTALMADAKSAHEFAEFLYVLMRQFKECVFRNNGIFDKFTGDGLLCYYPDFYSGKDSLYYALKTAQELHSVYYVVYKQFLTIFEVDRAENGIGIGIDYGDIEIKLIADDVTIIGKPVIYACRLNSAPAGVTWVNNPAYLILKDKYKNNIVTIEKDVCNFKNQGKMNVYKAEINEDTFVPEPCNVNRFFI